MSLSDAPGVPNRNAPGGQGRGVVGSFKVQLKALLRKNYRIKSRKRKELLNEIFYPFMMTMVICVIKVMTKPDSTDFPMQPVGLASPVTVPGIPIRERVLAYGPCTDDAGVMSALASSLRNTSGGLINVTAQHFGGPDASLDAIYARDPADFWAGVRFDGTAAAAACNFSDPGLQYTILMKEFNLFNPSPKAAIPGNSEDARAALTMTGDATCRGNWLQAADNATLCPAGLYVSSGFAALEAGLDGVLASGGVTSLAWLSLQQAPKESFTVPSDDKLAPIAVMMIIMGFAPLVQFLMVHLVTEKEKGIKEAMYLMGMNMASYWLSWLLTYAVMMLIPCLLTTIIANQVALFANSNPACIFGILYLFGLSLIAIAMMLSPLFKVAKTAGMAGMLSTTIVSVGIFALKDITDTSTRWIVSFISPLAASLALQTALELEPYGGLDSSNFFRTGGNDSGGFSPADACLMLVLDTAIYLVVGWLLDGIVSGTGLFRTISIMRRSKRPLKGLSVQADPVQAGSFERVHPSLEEKMAITVDEVSKSYRGTATGQRKNALDKVSFRMYADQIFALLGHNGAGKSTLHRIMTGLMLPTTGTVRIFGYDVATTSGRNHIRKIMGVCPQHDILYDTLTVAEHLELFGLIKGVPPESLDEVVRGSVTEVHLADQADVASDLLSGGQQRKLSVAIALIGDPSVICLDEPTSGMDPYSRRQLWDLLQAKRKGRVILFTTHQMDEADILADRKTILAAGSLKCLGSSLFLKSKFGVGYHLNIIQHVDGSEDRLSQLVNRTMGDQIECSRLANLQTAAGNARELEFSLPIRCVPLFPQLFDAMSNDAALSIGDYGISMTTLEEVFLRLAKEPTTDANDATDLVKAAGMKSRNSATSFGSTPNSPGQEPLLTGGRGRGGKDDTDDDALLSIDEGAAGPGSEAGDAPASLPTWGQQIKALMKVRAIQMMRSKLALTFQIVLPCIMMTIGLALVLKPKTAGDDLEPLSFDAMVGDLDTTIPVWSSCPGISDCANFVAALGNRSRLGVTTRSVNSSLAITDLGSADFAPYSAGVLVDNGGADGPRVTLLYNSSVLGIVPYMIGPVVAAYSNSSSSRQQPSRHAMQHSQPLAFEPTVPFDSDSFNAILFVGIALSVVPGGFAIELVRERQLRTKHQLFASGVPSSAYYGAHLFASCLLMAIPCVTSLILAQAVGVTPLIGPAFLATTITLMLYTPMTILLAFAVSHGFVEPDSCQQLTAALNMASFMPFIAVGVTDGLGPDHYNTVVSLHYLFAVLDPPYTLLGAFYFIFRVSTVANLTPGGEPATVGDYFAIDNHVLPTFLIMIAQGCAFAVALFYLETGRLPGPLDRLRLAVGGMRGKKKAGAYTELEAVQDGDSGEIDGDVLAAEERVNDIGEPDPDELIRIHELKKSFRRKGGKVKRAVKGLSFGIRRGEVLGLLGPNGAGKTTSMSMLTGAQAPGEGDAYIGGHSVKNALGPALQQTGYCPQFSALFPLVTVREHLLLFARLRGYAPAAAASKAVQYIELMGIKQYTNTRAANLSGGTQRKLSVAIALIGNPTVVLLDEPSTGMDPATRRFLWNVIKTHTAGRATILTTHAMEEAEALCSTIAIMVDGRLRCIGSAQHLKAKFGKDFTLEIKSDPAREDGLKRLIANTFEVAVPLEVYTGHCVFRVRGGGGMAAVFRLLEQVRDQFGIEEFSYSQPTLEQVFLGFAKEQIAVDLAAERQEVYE